ncbi:RNA polymerase sigma factor [Actinomadura parmotrematis]|uniref:RNA polymerase sigma factor n=1 Tax=Actinomadura parmotrematis TaxID=2864039 RepID=A0ABS7FNP5_9ACTN|nr:RNA polymerase sigma factor [Actinomadura parmotrematis]MBW8482000.1 RNA polymerase sigma factor [Actinomadura parmotrematis]
MTAVPDTDPRAGTDTGADADGAALAASLRDPERFTEIYDRHFAAVHRYVAGRLGPDAAEDVVAETFLAAFRRRASFDAARGAVRPWLFGIATNLVAGHRRTETRRYRALARVGAEPPAPGHEDGVLARVAAADARPGLSRALAALKQRDRDVVLLVALGRLSHAEIAAALGVPAGTVASRLNRARRELRAALTPQGR